MVALLLTNWDKGTRSARVLDIIERRAKSRVNALALARAEVARQYFNCGNDRAAFTWAHLAVKALGG